LVEAKIGSMMPSIRIKTAATPSVHDNWAEAEGLRRDEEDHSAAERSIMRREKEHSGFWFGAEFAPPRTFPGTPAPE